MTLEELSRSEQTQEWFKGLLVHPVFAAVLDALQREALPTSRLTPSLVPGVHYDTTLAHDDRYRAGWSDVIEAIRAIPSGVKPRVNEPDEEPFAHDATVQEIDAHLERLKKATPAPSTP